MTDFALGGSLNVNTRDFIKNMDKAADAADDAAEAVDKLDAKKAEPKAELDDKATRPILDLDRKLDGLDANDVEVKLKAEASRLQKEIAQAERDVEGLDGKTAAPILKIRNQAKADLDEVEAQLRKDIPDAAEDGGGDAAKGLAEGFADLKGAGGVLLGGAVAGAVVKGLQVGMERLKVAARFRQEFGLVKEDAARFGELAADIYADGWSDGTAPILSALGRVDQRLVQTGEVAKAETEGIAKAALGMAEVWDIDVDGAIRSISQLMLNDMAPSATAATDIMIEGLQNGANGAGDFFETIDEYAQHFSAFGIGADEMTQILVTGMQQGQRDTDKLADAVKEMRLRTTDAADNISAAYADLGLDADEYRAKVLAGGPAAREAFSEIIAAIQAVEDPAERNRLAVELIGTQYEDLGPKALDILASIDTALGDTAGNTAALVTDLEQSVSETEKLWRGMQNVFGTLGEGGAGIINGFAEDIQRFGNNIIHPFSAAADAEADARDRRMRGILAFGPLVEDLAKSIDDERRAVTMSTAAVTASTSRWQGQADAYAVSEERAAGAALAVNDLGKEQQAAKNATGRAAAASYAAAEALDEQRQQALDLVDQIEDLIGAQGRLVGGELAVEDATFRAADAMRDLTDTLNDGEASEQDRAEALNNAKQAQLDAAAAAADYEIAQREANGETLTATQKNEAMRTALLNVASTLEAGSPVRVALEGWAADLDGIPDEVNTVLGLDDDEAKNDIDAFKRKIDTVPRRVTTTFYTQNGSPRNGPLAMTTGGLMASGGDVRRAGLSTGPSSPTDHGRPSAGWPDGRIPFEVDGHGRMPGWRGPDRPFETGSHAGGQPGAFAPGGSAGPSVPDYRPGGSGDVATFSGDIEIYIGDQRITEIVDVRISQRHELERIDR